MIDADTHEGCFFPPATLNLWCERNEVDPCSWPFGPEVTFPAAAEPEQ